MRRRGLMLINMLVVIALLGAFMIVGERVFRLSLQTTQRAAREQEFSIRLEQALGALRQDVWTAKTVEAVDASHLRLGNVEWKTQKDGAAARSEKDQEQKWEALRLEFSKDGSWISVKRNGAEAGLLRIGGGR